MHVHLLYPPEPENLDLLRSLLDDRITLSVGEILPEHSSSEVLVAGRPTSEQLNLLPDLNTVIVPWTGIPPETLSAVRGIPHLKLHNLHHNAVPTAELAITLLLTVAKKVIPFDQKLRQGNWEMRYLPFESCLLAGKRALIVGYGKIGKHIGKVLEGLDIEVQAITRSAAQSSESNIASPDQLQSYLPQTDILFLALPYTNETEGMIGKEELALLPKKSILVNISRGNIIDQKSLYSALKEGRLFGAGLDVWFNYPEDEAARKNTLPGDYPFHELDNLVLSPHRAGHVQETEILRMESLAVLLNAAARDEQIPNSVNINLGY